MPDEAKLKLKATLRKTRGNVEAAARVLQISSKHLRRYLVRLRLSTALEDIRKTSGWQRPELRGGEKLTRWTRKQRRRRAAKRA